MAASQGGPATTSEEKHVFPPEHPVAVPDFWPSETQENKFLLFVVRCGRNDRNLIIQAVRVYLLLPAWEHGRPVVFVVVFLCLSHIFVNSPTIKFSSQDPILWAAIVSCLEPDMVGACVICVVCPSPTSKVDPDLSKLSYSLCN